jgi:Glycoside Hydrolase Family 113
VSIIRNRFWPLLTGVLAAALLSGCSGVGIGPGVPPKQDWTTQATAPPATTTTQQPSTSAQIGGMPILKVKPGAADLSADLGIQVFWNSTGSQADMEADANRIFNYVVGLGANSVGVDFWFFTDGPTPTRVYGVPGRTPSPATIAMVTKIAREHGLRVTLRPLLNEDNIKIVGTNWRGSIQPPELDSWFASYYAFLKPYLQVAQSDGASTFNIGTELDSLAPDESHWKIFENTVSQIYKGQQEYAVNYGRWEEDPSYEPVPDAAVDAWPQLGVSDSATIPQLTSAWETWLRNQPSSVLSKTTIQEVGLAAAAGAYKEPALSYAAGTPLDVTVQRNWLTAACDAAKGEHMAGIFYYSVNSTDRPSEPAVTAKYAPGSFMNRSDDAIKACFASGWS